MARLISLTDKTCEFDAKNIEVNLSALLSIAGQQKPVEFHLEDDETGSLRIVGFIYPAP